VTPVKRPNSGGSRPAAPIVGQRWDPERYRRNAAFVPALGREVVALLAPRKGERILDLGCGDGTLTCELARTASVLGVDASAEQIAACRARGLDARVADGNALAFDNEFDAVFSNAALHWMRDPDGVIASVWRALKPGGRFAAECGGAGNVAHVIKAALDALKRRGIDGEKANPWYFPPPGEYRAKLEAQGFKIVSMMLFQRPTALPGPLGDWLDTFAECFLALLPESGRAAFKREVEEALRPHLFKGGVWVADYVRLRFAAHKPLGQPVGRSAARPA
jgi:trans-aconitate methyltransferase